MGFAHGFSAERVGEKALREALSQAVGVDRPELVLVFMSPHYLRDIESIASLTESHTSVSGVSFGCVAEGVVAGSEEFEGSRGLSVFAGSLPEMSAAGTHLRSHRTEEGVGISGWPDDFDDAAGVIMLADPFSFPASGFLTSVTVPVVGGLAQNGTSDGALFLNGRVLDTGAVAVALSGPITFRTLVSQGCRPIGDPITVTATDGQKLLSLGSTDAATHLADVIDGLSEQDRRLASSGIHLGVVVDEYLSEFSRGDFLIRGVLGIDENDQSVLVGAHIVLGQTVQFHIRDPSTAHDDLRACLSETDMGGAVLVFTCNGRGRRFFEQDHHDASEVWDFLRPQALAGMISAGEIGPVGDQSFVHGYTVSLLDLHPS